MTSLTGNATRRPDVHAESFGAQRDRYVERLIQAGSAIALPELRRPALADALYGVSDRCGVGVVAVADGALDERQRDALARFLTGLGVAGGLVTVTIRFWWLLVL